MTAAASAPSGSPLAAPIFGEVLRLAWGILRRHAALFALLYLALEIAPVLLHQAMTGPVRRAIAPPFATFEAYVVALTLYYADFGAYRLIESLAFVCNVAVVLVGLEGDRPFGAAVAEGRGIVLRLIAPNVLVWVASEFLLRRLPQPWGSCVYAVLSCWTVVLPVYAAEKTPLVRLVGRSRAVFARGGRVLLGILGVYCAGAVGLSSLSLHFFDVFGRGQAAVWAGLAATWAASALFNVLADMAVVALYRELRRRERATPPPEVVEAFT